MTATLQPESKSPSRRAVLAAALGGAAAMVARSVIQPNAARAAGDDAATIHIGDTYADAQSQTTIGNQANNNVVLWVASNNDIGFGGGTAVVGFSHHGTGVNGLSNSTGTGVHGTSSSGSGVLGGSGSGTGVHGTSSSGYGVLGGSGSGTGVRGISGSGFGVEGVSFSSFGIAGNSSTNVGVFGSSSASDHSAIVGQSNGNSTGILGCSGSPPTARAKTGVYGFAAQDSSARAVFGQTIGGVGLYGQATSGLALQTSGRTKFSTSGVATITAGSKSKTITPGVNVTSGSFVLLTAKADIGARRLWFTTDASGNKITIHMSSSRSSGTKVAWLLLG
jgi:hypothetical protein